MEIAKNDSTLENISSLTKQLTKALLENDIEELENLTYISCEVLGNTRLENDIQINTDFYAGYIYAINNMASNYIDFQRDNEKIIQELKSNLKLNKIVELLKNHKALREQDIMKQLYIEEKELQEITGKLDIISVYCIGKQKVYSLTTKCKYIVEN